MFQGLPLGLAIIAEGVESEEQRICLARMGCKGFQGYLFCPPLPVEDFERFARATGRVSPSGRPAEDRAGFHDEGWALGSELPPVGYPVLS